MVGDNLYGDLGLDTLVDEIPGVEEKIKQVYDRIFQGLTEYCKIPSAFRHCRLKTDEKEIESLGEEEYMNLINNPSGVIINPKDAHKEAIEFFELLLGGNPEICEDGDPLRPQLGAYLFGPPGVGKTHIMVAYAIELRALLNKQLGELKRLVREKVRDFYKEGLLDNALVLEEVPEDVYVGSRIADLDKDIDTRKPKTGGERLEESIQNLVETIRRRFKYKPTDVLFIGFDPLYELCASPKRKEALDALVSSPVVFIDDMHPKGNPERESVIQHIIERRYEEGHGATFITSNLEDSELIKGDKQIGQRIHSRCSEIFYTIDFSFCSDWRELVKSKRISRIKRIIQGRLT